MKRLFTILLATFMIVSLFGCEKAGENATANASSDAGAQAGSAFDPDSYKLSSTLHIGALKGPTGIGMAYLFEMEAQGYDVQLFDSPDQVSAKLISGELDCAAVPSNLGALLYSKTEGQVYCLGINTGSTLYIVGKNENFPESENAAADSVSVASVETVGGGAGTDATGAGEGADTSVSVDNAASDIKLDVTKMVDLKNFEGKTIYSAGQGGVPEYVLSALLDSAGVKANVEFLSSHADVASKVLSSEGEAYGLLPEPNVTVIKSKSKAQSTSEASSNGESSADGASTAGEVETLVDIGALWETSYKSTLPMGILVARKESYDAHTADMQVLKQACKASTEKVLADREESAELIARLGIVPSAELAKAVIPNCSLMFEGEISAEKSILEDFYSILYNYNKKAVGGALPGEEYYE